LACFQDADVGVGIYPEGEEVLARETSGDLRLLLTPAWRAFAVKYACDGC
jgi:hypothetical protein